MATNSSGLTNTDVKKINFVRAVDEKGNIVRVVSPNDFQVGTRSAPANMHVSGVLTVGSGTIKITSNGVQFGKTATVMLSGGDLKFFDAYNMLGLTLSQLSGSSSSGSIGPAGPSGSIGPAGPSGSISGVSLQPSIIPDLLTVSMPMVGHWWSNTPAYNGTTMHATTNGYSFSAFGGSTLTGDAIGIKVDSVPAANQGCGWQQTSSETDISRRPWFRGRVKISSTAADQGVWVGWGSGLSGVGAVSNNTLALSCETVVAGSGGNGQSTWQVTSKATGAVDYVDTLVPYTANHDYELYISVVGSDVIWAIYDYTTTTAYSGSCISKANLPSSTAGLGVLYTGISGTQFGASLQLTWGPCLRGQFGFI